MKKIKQILVIVIGVSVICIGLSYAQPQISKEDIPANIASDVKEAIEMLYSSDAQKRVEGVEQLRRMEKDHATPAIPYLIEILNDNTTLAMVSKAEVDPSSGKVTLTQYFISSVSGVEERLAKILGEFEVKSLSRASESVREAFIVFLTDNPRIRSSTMRFMDSSGKEVVLVREVTSLSDVARRTLMKIRQAK